MVHTQARTFLVCSRISMPASMKLILFLLLSLFSLIVFARSADEDNRCIKVVEIYESVESPAVTERNRGRQVHCTYRIRVRPARDDWIVFIRFTRLRVGRPSDDRRRCEGGYVQVVDGYRDSNHSNREAPGFYCGEIDSPKTFISETPFVKIIFHADSYDHDTYMHFDANYQQQKELTERYGPHFQLYPARRGIPVPNTYCHRTFNECSPGRCFIQSPGFPGIYPRNLVCKYRISIQQGLVGLDLQTFDVDGLRCDNLLMCFPRPVTKNPEDCPFDLLRIYDGPSEDHPLMATLCGRGRLKSNIIASGKEMLVTFATSPAGPLLNTGFHFKAETVLLNLKDGEPAQLKNTSCSIFKNLSDSQTMTFANPRSWYPPNTTCKYRFTAPEGHLIRIEFVVFRVERITLCEEALRIYDSLESDPRFIITKLCDTNRPKTEQPRALFESTGPTMLLEFHSKTGSLDGSSISFTFEVRTLSAAIYENLVGEPCNRRFTAGSDGSRGGTLAVHPLDFIDKNKPIICNYTFDARTWAHGRVKLTILSMFEKKTDNCNSCPKLTAGRAEIFVETRNERTICLCHFTGNYGSHTIASVGPVVQITLYVPPTGDLKRPSASNNKDREKIFEIFFTFYSDTRCGPERLDLDLQGSLKFPADGPFGRHCPDCAGPGDTLYCRWQAPVLQQHDVSFRLEGFNALSNCTTDYLLIDDVALCPNPPLAHSVLLHRGRIRNAVVPLEFRSSDPVHTSFTLWWTQVNILPTPSTPDTLVSLSKDCEFLCASSMVCIKKELVCNGVPNCPHHLPGVPSSSGSFEEISAAALASGIPSGAADEDETLCSNDHTSFQMYWYIIGGGLAVCACVVVCFVFSVFRRCRAGRHRF